VRGSQRASEVRLIGRLIPKARLTPPFGFKDSYQGIRCLGGIKDGPVADDLLQGGIDTECGPVRAMGRHGLGHIGNGKYLRLHHNQVAGKALWVSGAVQTLVMLEHCGRYGPRELYFFQNIVPCLGMGLDKKKFIIGKRARFGENFGRNDDFSNLLEIGTAVLRWKGSAVLKNEGRSNVPVLRRDRIGPARLARAAPGKAVSKPERCALED